MKTVFFWGSVLLSGMLFGAGLAIATMIQPEVVLSFLTFDDMGLVLVLAAASTLSLLVYQLAPRWLRRPLWAANFASRPSATLRNTLLGALLFGVGWGMSGVCPGPAIAGLGAGNWPLLWSIAGMLAGAYVQGRWFGADSQ